MPLYANYDAWVTGIRELLDVDSSEYSDAKIGEFLFIGETSLNRLIRTRRTEDHVSTTIESDTGGRISLPSDLNEPQSLYLHATGLPIDVVTRDQFFYRKSANVSHDTYPEIYCIIGNYAHFYPLGSGLEVSLIYYKDIVHLESGVTESNEFSSYYPDALLYASALAAGPYMLDDVRLPIWRSELNRIVSEINMTKQSEKMGSSPLKRNIRSMSGR